MSNFCLSVQFILPVIENCGGKALKERLPIAFGGRENPEEAIAR